MSKKDINKIVKIYGDTELHFETYYKYNFFYSGVASDGKKIELSNFGDSDDIYRSDLMATQTLESLCYELPVNWLKVADQEYTDEENL